VTRRASNASRSGTLNSALIVFLSLCLPHCFAKFLEKMKQGYSYRLSGEWDLLGDVACESVSGYLWELMSLS